MLPEVIDPLLAIINSSLSLGYVPKTFKLGVIKPLIKKTQLDPKDLVNYRPISNLPFLTKILEKVASSQLYSFIEKNYICEDFQSGFRPSHNTFTFSHFADAFIQSDLRIGEYIKRLILKRQPNRGSAPNTVLGIVQINTS